MRNQKLKLLFIMLMVILVILAACGSVGSQFALEPKQQSIALPVIDTDASSILATPQNLDARTTEQRIVLKDATLQIVVDNVTSAIDMISKLAEDMGGWVISSSTSKSSYASGNDAVIGSIAIRVPAAKLNDALTQIKGQSTSVDSETLTGKDVTQDYTDLTSQLTNLQAAEKQLQTILDSAHTTDDVLKIYNELVRVRGEIETTQGRINYYKEASDFSSITVSLRPPTVAQAAVQVDTEWSPTATVKGAFNALVNILQGIASLIIIVIVLIVPLLIVVGIPLWLLYKLSRRFGWFIFQKPVPASHLPTNTKVENDGG